MTNNAAMKFFLSFLLVFSFFSTHAQVETDSAQFDQVRGLVNFYKYMLNTVGSQNTSPRDKEVIISQSYKKAFSHADVQIEDDLLLNRKVITNKDVSAYLRDVDFFFENIQFDFQTIEIKRIDTGDDTFYFLVSFESTSTGTTLEGENQTLTKNRFIEVNYNKEADDLKIASVYSTKVSREEELETWWKSLSFGWKEVFRTYVPFDTISRDRLLKIALIDSLNLSENQFIIDLNPLSALKQLKQLDISKTKIEDLSPLRYARGFERLCASQTRVKDITVLEYFENITEINLSDTDVSDVSTLGRLHQVVSLNLSNTTISDFSSLNELISLQRLNLSNTSFDDPTIFAKSIAIQSIDLSKTLVDHLYVFQSLPEVVQLNLSESKIVNLNGLEAHPSLEILSINRTLVEKLDPINELPKLKKVYADLSSISEETASVFMEKNNEVVVVTNSEQLIKWWSDLPDNWKNVLSEKIGVTDPTKEDLSLLMNLDSLDVSNKKLYAASPLKKLKRLRYLDISHNDLGDFDFTSDMADLENLIASNIPTQNTSGLEKNKNLRQLNLTDSKVDDIQSLKQLHKLEVLNLAHTMIEEAQVVNYLKTNPETVVIYQTELLDEWWKGLTKDWQNAFGLSNPTSNELHQLIEREEIALANQNIISLTPLNPFVNLKKVTLDRVQVQSLNELYVHKTIQSLTYTNGPLQSLVGIDQLGQLEYLNISNTAIEDLKGLHELQSLKHLNCSGTGIKSFRGLDDLTNIESLDVSNTRIWRLERLYGLLDLKTFVCNNTRLSQAKVDAFQEMHPECKIIFY